MVQITAKRRNYFARNVRIARQQLIIDGVWQ